MPARKRRGVQQLVIPKGLIAPGEIAVVEIPKRYDRLPVVIAKKEFLSRVRDNVEDRFVDGPEYKEDSEDDANATSYPGQSIASCPGQSTASCPGQSIAACPAAYLQQNIPRTTCQVVRASPIEQKTRSKNKTCPAASTIPTQYIAQPFCTQNVPVTHCQSRLTSETPQYQTASVPVQYSTSTSAQSNAQNPQQEATGYSQNVPPSLPPPPPPPPSSNKSRRREERKSRRKSKKGKNEPVPVFVPDSAPGSSNLDSMDASQPEANNFSREPLQPYAPVKNKPSLRSKRSVDISLESFGDLAERERMEKDMVRRSLEEFQESRRNFLKNAAMLATKMRAERDDDDYDDDYNEDYDDDDSSSDEICPNMNTECY